MNQKRKDWLQRRQTWRKDHLKDGPGFQMSIWRTKEGIKIWLKSHDLSDIIKRELGREGLPNNNIPYGSGYTGPPLYQFDPKKTKELCTEPAIRNKIAIWPEYFWDASFKLVRLHDDGRGGIWNAALLGVVGLDHGVMMEFEGLFLKEDLACWADACKSFVQEMYKKYLDDVAIEVNLIPKKSLEQGGQTWAEKSKIKKPALS